MAPAQLGGYFHVNFMKMQHFWIQKMEKFSEPDFTKYETFLDPKINEINCDILYPYLHSYLQFADLDYGEDEPDDVGPDRAWGYCDKMCHRKQLKPDLLQEVINPTPLTNTPLGRRFPNFEILPHPDLQKWA